MIKQVAPNSMPAIVGPTGVGKTALALAVAKAAQYELISADSRQVYASMDIGTGKEVHLGQWQSINSRPTLTINDVLIHGLNLTTPDQLYSIADWHAQITQIIAEIYARQKSPLIVGGTGFYLQALQGKVQTLSIPPNPQLRHQLQKLTTSQLYQKLSDLNQAKARSLNQSDRHNPARLTRLIEIEQSSPASSLQSPVSVNPISLQLIGLTRSRQDIYDRSDARTDHMIAQGLVEEVKLLIDQYGPHQAAFKTIGYAEIIEHLHGRATLEQAIQSIKHHNHHYIRRQYTWFNKQQLGWLDANQADIEDRILDMVNK